jgi:hypothetical protein
MTDLTADQIKQAVDAVLTAARLPVSADEYERLVQNYPYHQSQLAQLRFPEARYLEPADIYRP